eukprot:tig00001095_g7036.t1
MGRSLPSTRSLAPIAGREGPGSGPAGAGGGVECAKRLSVPGQSDIRRVRCRVVLFGKKEAWSEAAAGHWGGRIGHYTAFEEVLLKPAAVTAGKELAKAQAEDADRVLKLVTPGKDFLVALDERGRALSSEGLADILREAAENGYEGVTFSIGGPFGHGGRVREAADRVVSLSACVLNHQVARILLLEQIYRAWTILRGEPYHH